MPVKISCPHCNRDLRLPEDLYNQMGECPVCRGAFHVRWRNNPQASQKPVPFAPSDVRDEDRRPCPFCGKPIMARAVKCRFCREWLSKTGH
jgi:hypothetical protein